MSKLTSVSRDLYIAENKIADLQSRVTALEAFIKIQNTQLDDLTTRLAACRLFCEKILKIMDVKPVHLVHTEPAIENENGA
jgi:hypothetical protein